jgi:hypothetical protein
MSATELLKQCEALSARLQAMGLPHPEPNDDWAESIARINAAVSQLAGLVGNVKALTDLIAMVEQFCGAKDVWVDIDRGILFDKLTDYKNAIATLKAKTGG